MGLPVGAEINQESAQGGKEEIFPPIVVRNNYGILFERYKTIENSATTWSHTFAIPFAKKIHVDKPIKLCNVPSKSQQASILPENLQSICKIYKPSFQAYNVYRREILSQLVDNHKKIQALIPLYSRSTLKRTKRGYVDIIGQFSKALFGTATMSDVVMLQKQIDAIETTSNHEVEYLKITLESMQSYQQTLNTRITNLKRAAELNKNLLNSTIQTLNQWRTRLQQLSVTVRHQAIEIQKTRIAVNLLHTYSVQQVHMLEGLLRDSEMRVQAVQTLLEGYLPIYYIPPHKLKQFLNKLHAVLLKDYPTFRIAQTEVKYYYTAPNVVYLRTRNQLYIKIKIPITTTDTLIHFYHVTALPVPTVTNHTTYVTKISGFSEYIGITNSELFYVETNRASLELCSGKQIQICPRIFAMNDRAKASCTSALFHDEQENIKTKCQTHLMQAKEIEPYTFSDLGQGRVLVNSKDPFLVKTCALKPPVKLASCQFCILKLPCACNVRSAVSFFPATLNQCQNSEKITFLHPVNLMYAQHVVDYASIFNISGSSVLAKPLKLPSIKFNAYKENWEQVVEKDKVLELDLNKTAYLAKKKMNAYVSAADELSYRLHYVRQSYSGPLLIGLPGLNLVLTVVVLSLAAYNFYKLRDIRAQ